VAGKRKWTTELIVVTIKSLHTAGVRLNSRSIRVSHPALYRVAQVRFGSWKAAIEAAGFEYEDVKISAYQKKRKWPRQRVIRLIKRLYRRGVDLSSQNVTMKYPRLMGGARMAFKTWRKAIEAADIDYSAVAKRPNMVRWSKKLIITRIQERVREGLRINVAIVKCEDNNLYVAALRHFKHWSEAVEAAGFSYWEVREDRWWTPQLVILEIKRRAHMGESISLLDVRTENSGLYCGAKRCYGSWKQAVEAAGFVYGDVRKYEHWSKELIIEQIQFRHENGLPINFKAVDRTFSALAKTAAYHFGTWEAAVEAAGFSYDLIIQRWIFKRRKSSLEKFSDDPEDN
jgi:hypothetical protein